MIHIPFSLDEPGPPPTLLPYQLEPLSHYLEQIRSGRKMLEEVCSNQFYSNDLSYYFLTQQEETDTNASIYGNRTIENVKGRLHQYLQKNNLPQEY